MKKRKLALAICSIALVAFTLAACGQKEEFGGSSSGTSPAATTPIDGSTIGVDTKTISHDEFTASANHSGKLCTDCHSVPRDQVCAQSGCHPFSKYGAVMANWDHTLNKTGEQCSKCHQSVEVNKAGEDPKVAGWRTNLRVSHTLWHTALKGVCTDCHDYNNISNFPSSHGTDRQSGCENCHYYKLTNGAASWGGGHTNATSGCNVSGCHSKHYSGYDCVLCHAGSVTNKYSSWNTYSHNNVNDAACSACHGGGGFSD